MKPPPFSYHDPRTDQRRGRAARPPRQREAACGRAIADADAEHALCAAGPCRSISTWSKDCPSSARTGGALEIGAMTRQRDLEYSDVVRRRCPLMHEAIQLVGHRQTRNRGTIGGSLCHLDPSAELVSVAAAHDATTVIAGPGGTREVAFSDFPVAFMTPAVELNELLTAVRFTLWPEGHGHGVRGIRPPPRRFRHRLGRSAADRRRRWQVSRVLRSRSAAWARRRSAPATVEQALIGNAPSDALLREACETCRKFDALDDVHAPASYRQHLATVMSRRALQQARSRLPSHTAKAN